MYWPVAATFASVTFICICVLLLVSFLFSSQISFFLALRSAEQTKYHRAIQFKAMKKKKTRLQEHNAAQET
jgi:hypothetical protein